MSKISGSEIVIECLKEQGVDTVFGYPGGTILNVYDALYKHQDEINHVLTSHEQGAAHAAGWICQSYRQGRRMYGHMRSGCHQPCNRYSYSIHGFHSCCGNNSKCRCKYAR